MQRGFPETLGLSLVIVSILLLTLVAPAWGQRVLNPPMPIWATINADATGNYPGGNELFIVFIVNSAVTHSINETIDNATLVAPWPGGSNFGTGLPTNLSPGQAVSLSIYLQIPSNYTQPNFNANLVIHATILNGTSTNHVTLTGTATVNVLNLSSQTSTQTGTPGGGAQAGTVSSSTFYLGVAVPSIVAIIFLVLFAQARSSSKRPGT